MKATLAVLAATCVVAVPLLPALAACEGETPLSVLDCYSQAYEDRDVDALDEVYASEYTWIDIVPPGALVFQRADAMKSAVGMFGHPDARALSLSFGGDFALVEDETDGTWRIEGVEVTLEALYGDGDKPYTAKTCATYYVRNNGEGYEIFREVTIGDGGCDVWGDLLTSE